MQVLGVVPVDVVKGELQALEVSFTARELCHLVMAFEFKFELFYEGIVDWVDIGQSCD